MCICAPAACFCAAHMLGPLRFMPQGEKVSTDAKTVLCVLPVMPPPLRLALALQQRVEGRCHTTVCYLANGVHGSTLPSSLSRCSSALQFPIMGNTPTQRPCLRGRPWAGTNGTGPWQPFTLPAAFHASSRCFNLWRLLFGSRMPAGGVTSLPPSCLPCRFLKAKPSGCSSQRCSTRCSGWRLEVRWQMRDFFHAARGATARGGPFPTSRFFPCPSASLMQWPSPPLLCPCRRVSANPTTSAWKNSTLPPLGACRSGSGRPAAFQPKDKRTSSFGRGRRSCWRGSRASWARHRRFVWIRKRWGCAALQPCFYDAS